MAMLLRLSAKSFSVAIRVEAAFPVLTAILIVDAIAIADAQPFTGAVAPDRMLNVAREDFWKAGVELTGIDALAQHRQH
jgi:hypothetical protein